MIDWEREGLLDGLESEAERASRRELLGRLYDDGCSVGELRQAVAEDRLALLPLERMLLEERCYSVAQAAAETGLSQDYVERNWRALGLTFTSRDDPLYTEDNVRGMRGLKPLIDAGVTERELIEITRMIGDASNKLADAVMRTFGSTLLQPGDTERDIAERFAQIAAAAMPSMGPWLQGPLRAHLAEAARHGAIGQMERQTGRVPGGRSVAICFADMVGFTARSQQLDIDALGEVTQRFTDVTAELAEPPVRLVKTIGDEAMLASEDAPALVEVALELIAAAARDDLLPPLRAGAAAGEALRRAGDWYGPPVNLAARITTVAPDGGLLADHGLRVAAGESFDWAEAGRRGFKGIDGEVALYRAERSAG